MTEIVALYEELRASGSGCKSPGVFVVQRVYVTEHAGRLQEEEQIVCSICLAYHNAD
jgi:hypothetical protein